MLPEQRAVVLDAGRVESSRYADTGTAAAAAGATVADQKVAGNTDTAAATMADQAEDRSKVRPASPSSDTVTSGKVFWTPPALDFGYTGWSGISDAHTALEQMSTVTAATAASLAQVVQAVAFLSADRIEPHT